MLKGATFPKCPRSSCRYSGRRSTKNVAALEQETKRSVEPGIQWFLRKFNADLYNTLSAFKAARVMCPEAVQSLRPTPATAQGLRLFPFLDSNHVINGLITELPKYVAAAHNVTMAWRTKWSSGDSTQIDCHIGRLQSWKFLQVQPSSAAAERVFSIINCSFNDSQDHALVDFVQAVLCFSTINADKRVTLHPLTYEDPLIEKWWAVCLSILRNKCRGNVLRHIVW